MRTVIGTRGSALALAQAHWAAERLAAAGLPCELEVIRTAGDVDQHSPFAQVGAPGVFVREIEQALLDGRIDIAVHSYKDLPSRSPAGLEVVAVPEREDPRDVLVTRAPPGPGAVVGTSAARRRVLVGELHPGWRPRELRGNVPTRVEKLRRGDYDAIVLAAAGLARLQRAGGIDLAGLQIEPLDPRRFVPAPAQGALALQMRAGDPRVPAVRGLDLTETRRAVRAERRFLELVDAGCDAVVGAFASPLPDDRLELVALLESAGRPARTTVCGADPEALAGEAFEILAGQEARP